MHSFFFRVFTDATAASIARGHHRRPADTRICRRRCRHAVAAGGRWSAQGSCYTCWPRSAACLITAAILVASRRVDLIATLNRAGRPSSISPCTCHRLQNRTEPLTSGGMHRSAASTALLSPCRLCWPVGRLFKSPIYGLRSTKTDFIFLVLLMRKLILMFFEMSCAITPYIVSSLLFRLRSTCRLNSASGPCSCQEVYLRASCLIATLGAGFRSLPP